jgi:subtilisin-like proprotein convertase family protein
MHLHHLCRHRFIIGFVIVIAAVCGWLSFRKDSAPSEVTRYVPDAVPAVSSDLRADRAPKLSKFRAIPTSARVDSEEIWDFQLDGQPLSITLALDEAVLRDADGKETVARLDPPATQQTLPERLAAMSAPGGVFPVAYLAGEERSIASRRLVTPDLRVKLDAASAEKIANSHRLVIKDRPSYAPGWVIMSAENPFAALDAMINLRAVREVGSADVLLAVQHRLRALPNDPLVTSQWHLKKSGAAVTGSDVNVETAWNYPGATGSRGAGIRIGVVDDGMQTAHPDLAPNADTTNDKDWNGNDADPNPGTGDDHGTACAGNAAARGNNGIGVSGTAPEATLVGMRLIAAAVTDAQEAEAMNYLPDLIQIKTNSWGPDDTGDLLEAPGPLTLLALDNAATIGRGGKGSIILWAGGNGGDVGDDSNYDGYANSIHTIAIGATDSLGRRAYYSEPGANLVVCAPSSGNGSALGITTADRTGSNGYNTASSASGGDYTDDFGGTSSATPTAAGIVALMLEKNPNLGWRDVQEILIRTAAKPPSSTGWVDNAAGFHFNHDFGAGLIDATAAVNLAATWTNLPAQTSAISTQSGLSAAIPNNNSAGVSRTFDLSASNIRVEQVTLKLSATHSYRGDLEVTLTSPSGMVSRLAALHADDNANYSNWTFSSVRNWGELSTGTWTLRVADLRSGVNTSGGTLTAAELEIFGSPGTPVNPAPLVQITQPANGQVFSPGTALTVNVTASDLTISNSPGTVTQVELFDNGISLGIDTTAPYSFAFTPAIGSHSLVAEATDSESATGTSVSVGIIVVNQPPVVTAATLSAVGQAYSDVPLTVSSVTASDPESQPITYSYQWQSSVNQTVFTDEPGATTATAPALAGKLMRCVITASDGNSSGPAFTTAAVNLLTRPVTNALTGTAYSYSSGLVLAGTDSSLSRQAIIHEFSQGPSGSSSEWIEILTLQSGSLAYWDLHDAAFNTLVFLDDPIWDDIPAGTLIVIYNGASKDPLLPADDSDPSDGRMVLSSTDPAYFDTTYDAWLPLGNSGDSIFLADAESEDVHAVAYGNSTATTPNVGSVGSAKSAYFTGDTDSGADLAVNWRTTTSLTVRARDVRVPAALPIAFGGTWTTLPTGLTGSGLGSPYASSLGGDTATGSARFDDTGDSLTVEFASAATALTYQMKGNPSSGTATSGTFLVQESSDGLSYTTLRTVTNASNADTAYSDAPLAATRFIRFFYQSKSAGNIQLDKLAVSGTTTNGLTLTVSPTTFAENTGSSAATASVSLATAPGAPLTVTLGSSDTGEVTAPASVIIAAGQTVSPTFAITAVDDSDPDGTQQVVLTASAAGYADGTAVLTVTDNEPSVEGVTPAAANNTANLGFVTALRAGSLNSPALFRIGVGATVPVGLVLDPGTGVLSGTISSENPAGDYLIVIERYNTLGATVSQSFTLTLVGGAGDTYAAWIAGFPAVGALAGVDDDADNDGVPNGIENHFGTAPDLYSPGLTLVSSTGGNLVFRHSRTNSPASDLATVYEWSADLVTWHASDGNVAIGVTTVTDHIAPDTDVVEVSATVMGAPVARLFVRIRVDG